jgi:hypothetical protein
MIAALTIPKSQLFSTIKKPIPIGTDNNSAVKADNCFGDKFLVVNILLEDTGFKEIKGQEKPSLKKFQDSKKQLQG